MQLRRRLISKAPVQTMRLSGRPPCFQGRSDKVLSGLFLHVRWVHVAQKVRAWFVGYKTLSLKVEIEIEKSKLKFEAQRFSYTKTAPSLKTEGRGSKTRLTKPLQEGNTCNFHDAAILSNVCQ